MAEPTTTGTSVSVAVFAVSLLGPFAGPYAAILFGALVGALWAVSRKDTQDSDGKPSTARAALVLARYTLTAVALTGAVSTVLERTYGLPALESLTPVAVALGAMGDGWRPVFGAVGVALAAVISRLGGQNAGGGEK